RWLSMILFVLGGWILTICVHEFSHAIPAYWGGDRSVLQSGYLTWNPLRYVNPLFSIVIPLVFILLGGIGFPGGAIFFDPRALRSRGWQTGVALAGPAGTVVCFLLLASPFLSGVWLQLYSDQNAYFWAGLAALCLLEIAIFILNLLPIPPLDGWGAIAPYLPRDLQYSAMRYGTFIILGLFLLFWIPGINQYVYGGLLGLGDLFRVPDLLVLQGLSTLRPAGL
ncbi:MAG: site-2 protease family protein, partial [Candidatus Dormibacteraceae bacterium]